MSPRQTNGASPSRVDTDKLSDQQEPSACHGTRMPKWLAALFGAALIWAGIHVYNDAGAFSPLVFEPGDTLAAVKARVPRSEAAALMNHGRRVFATYCAACHQSHGRGVLDQFPPLTQSEWVLASGANRLIRIVLHGLDGPVTVKGQEFNNPMLPWHDQLSDEDVAAVLTFIRGNKDWGHNATPVSAEQVGQIRSADADRASSWTADELLSLPDSD